MSTQWSAGGDQIPEDMFKQLLQLMTKANQAGAGGMMQTPPPASMPMRRSNSGSGGMGQSIINQAGNKVMDKGWEKIQEWWKTPAEHNMGNSKSAVDAFRAGERAATTPGSSPAGGGLNFTPAAEGPFGMGEFGVAPTQLESGLAGLEALGAGGATEAVPAVAGAITPDAVGTLAGLMGSGAEASLAGGALGTGLGAGSGALGAAGATAAAEMAAGMGLGAGAGMAAGTAAAALTTEELLMLLAVLALV